MEQLIPDLIQHWRRLTKLKGPTDRLQTREFRGVVNTIKGLQETFQRGGSHYFNDVKTLADYLLYYWPLHYQEALSILSEIPSQPKKVLDLCSGPCPVAFAALKLGCSDVTALDVSLEAVKFGAEFCGRQGYPVTVKKGDLKKNSLPVGESYDLITIGHSLSELFPSSRSGWKKEQLSFVHTLLSRLSPDGHLVIIEGSFEESNRRVLSLRDELVSDGIPVQAPCVWRGKCPALEGNFPCYAQREYEKPTLLKELQRAASINLNSLKASYLIVRPKEAGWPQQPEQDLYRVVSPPFEKEEGKVFYLCGTPGKKKLSSRLKSLPQSAKAFEYLKRGELISVDGALEHQNSLILNDNTSLNVVAACGKPVPEVS